MVKPKGDRPVKPKDCPLFPHAGGTWAKKIDGRHVHFGPWDDLKGALKAFHSRESVAVVRDKPAPATQNPTLELLHDAYVTHQHDRAVDGAITLRSFRDIRGACKSFCGTVGWEVRYNQLAPVHFGAYAKTIGHYGAHAFNRNLTLVKHMFRWGVRSQMLPHDPPFGASFDKIPERVKRRQARDREARGGDRTFTPADIRSLLAAAEPHMRAMILLGVNCGFGNSDVAHLPISALDLGKGVVAYDRPKTGVARRATLWPETVTAIREWLKVRPAKPKPGNEHYVFITRFGNAFVQESSDVRDGVIQGVGVVDSVNLLFRKLVDKLDPPDEHGKRHKGLHRPGRSFYALRHTFRTWAEETGKLHPIFRIMGHELPGMSSQYVHHIPDSQLREVTSHVRGKVFPRSARAKRITRPGGTKDGTD